VREYGVNRVLDATMVVVVVVVTMVVVVMMMMIFWKGCSNGESHKTQSNEYLHYV
jgi:flagellar basal body-associated protein FliL